MQNSSVAGGVLESGGEFTAKRQQQETRSSHTAALLLDRSGGYSSLSLRALTQLRPERVHEFYCT